MESVLQFNPSWNPVVVEDSGVFLFGEENYRFLEGRPVAIVARKILDGSKTLDELMQTCEKSLEFETLAAIVGQMESEGYLLRLAPGITAELAAFYASNGFNPAVVASILGSRAVELRTTGPSLAGVEAFLSAIGIRRTNESGFAIVLADDFFDPALKAINDEMLSANRSWMLINPSGRKAWYAVFNPGVTGCWSCLTTRIAANRLGERLVRENYGIEIVHIPTPDPWPTESAPVYRRAVLDVLRNLVSAPKESEFGRLTIVDGVTAGVRIHRFVRLRSCSACGGPVSPYPRAKLELVPRLKNNSVHSGARTVSARNAFRRYSHLIDPLTGVVRSLHRVTSTEADPTFTYVARHPLAAEIRSISKLRSAETHVSGGKGRTRDEARASALFEALERSSGVWRGGIPVLTSSFSELAGEAVNPETLLQFSDEQYENRDVLNRHRKHVLHVPRRLDPEETIDWVPAWSLSREIQKYVPALYAYYEYPLSGTPFCIPNSNGCAAGITREEALLQALLEIIERDALSLWWYNRTTRRRIEIENSRDPWVSRMLEHYRGLGRDVWVLDVTSDIDVPVYVALSWTRNDRADFIMGFGCHLDSAIALNRALTELNQMLPKVRPHAIKGVSRRKFGPEMRSPVDIRGAANLEYLIGHSNQVPCESESRPNRISDDLLGDVQVVLDTLEASRFETLVIDQTHPDIEVPVVRVIVPEMYHYWRRFGGERLYEIPVRQGWLPTRREESEMNPLDIVQ